MTKDMPRILTFYGKTIGRIDVDGKIALEESITREELADALVCAIDTLDEERNFHRRSLDLMSALK